MRSSASNGKWSRPWRPASLHLHWPAVVRRGTSDPIDAAGGSPVPRVAASSDASAAPVIKSLRTSAQSARVG